MNHGRRVNKSGSVVRLGWVETEARGNDEWFFFLLNWICWFSYHCCLNFASAQNSYVEALSPSVPVFGGGVFMEIIKIPNRTGVFQEEETPDLSLSPLSSTTERPSGDTVRRWPSTSHKRDLPRNQPWQDFDLGPRTVRKYISVF